MEETWSFELESSWHTTKFRVRAFFYFIAIPLGCLTLLAVLIILLTGDYGHTSTQYSELSGEGEVNSLGYGVTMTFILLGPYVYNRFSTKTIILTQKGIRKELRFFRMKVWEKRHSYRQLTHVSFLQVLENGPILAMAVNDKIVLASAGSNEFEEEDVVEFFRVLEHYAEYYGYEVEGSEEAAEYLDDDEEM